RKTQLEAQYVVVINAKFDIGIAHIGCQKHKKRSVPQYIAKAAAPATLIIPHFPVNARFLLGILL
ncbi:MAG: hypothetical protein II514_02740, partial [Ruminococcus sp.]|nr:hypothetical protein [Ruminococcus sp.]